MAGTETGGSEAVLQATMLGHDERLIYDASATAS
ncbi:hypothetical protein ACVW1C_003531 [Bradyrhizobium sp. USDA 4011]